MRKMHSAYNPELAAHTNHRTTPAPATITRPGRRYASAAGKLQLSAGPQRQQPAHACDTQPTMQIGIDSFAAATLGADSGSARESAQEVCNALVRASNFIPKERLGSTDDCGFSPFSIDEKPNHGSPDYARDVAFQKITNRVLGTKMAAEKLGLL